MHLSCSSSYARALTTDIYAREPTTDIYAREPTTDIYARAAARTKKGRTDGDSYYTM